MFMKLFRVIKFTLITSAAAIPLLFHAIDLQPSFEMAYLNKYVWRGINGTNKPVLQPSASLAYEQFYFNLWGNFELTDINQSRYKFTEYDFTLSRGFNYRALNIETGLIHYRFPHTGNNPTSEVFTNFSINTLLSPSYGIYWDIDQASGGFYNDFSVSHQFKKVFDFRDDFFSSLDLAAHIGFASRKYNLSYFRVNAGHFSDYACSVSLPTQWGKWMFIPQVSFSGLINKQIRSKASYKKDNLVYGVNFSYSL